MPSELLELIFTNLDDKSLSRVSSVCKSWASLGKDVLASRGPHYKWLNVGSNISHASHVRRIFLRTRKDCGRRLSLTKVKGISIALSLLDNDAYRAALDIVAFSELPLPLSLTLYDDRPESTVDLSCISVSQMRRIHSQAFLMLACQGRLMCLVVETAMLPYYTPLDEVVPSLSKQ
jgi:hypothetical protein